MTNYPAPNKTLFFVCCSTVAAIVATEAGLLDNSDSYVANQSYDAFGDEWVLVKEEGHPWCGFGRMDDVEVGYLVPDRDDGGRFIDEDEYKTLKAGRIEKG
jgi:hypothetical protein